MTSRKLSSDCGVLERLPSATSGCQTFAATQRSMTACEAAQKSMTWMSGILEPGGWQSPSSIRRKIRAIHRYNAGCRQRPGRPRQDSHPLPHGRRVGRRHAAREKHAHLQTTADPGELEPFFNGAWSIFDVLEMNFRYRRYDPDELRDLVVGVKSRFYPQMGKPYERRVEAATR